MPNRKGILIADALKPKPTSSHGRLQDFLKRADSSRVFVSQDLMQALNIKSPSTLCLCFRGGEFEKFRYRVGVTVYYGSPKAIARLKKAVQSKLAEGQ